MDMMITGAPSPPDSFEDAVFQVQRLEADCLQTLQGIRDRQKALVRLRFREGAIVEALRSSAKYGDSAVTRLSQATGINETTLYECRRFFLLPEFDRSVSRLEVWMTETEERKGQVNWHYCRSLVHKQIDRKDPEAAAAELEKQARAIERRAERLEQDTDDLESRAQRLPVAEERREEAAGVAAKAREVASDTRQQTARMGAARVMDAPRERLPEEKPERYTDAKYLAFVRSYRCCVCDRQPADAHHLDTGGMGTKGPDYATVPLCRLHHQEYHTLGFSRFEAAHEVNLWKLAWRLVTEYFSGIPLTGS